ncbi:DUF1656 domain-containing protein [Psychromonas marina]|uniref:DUF1656 domain-containing protein n=1 Tax=Psychromonas marina TaxID=88364 RepID=A0ABQ6E0P7_9GAMM|nr:DUF1656 domain-containing protein [Psychromonas marina]GLS90788.1 DUF1656 domain-containing protein [Psychromonas marina]
MTTMPHELIFGEIYLPPLLFVVALAYILTSIVSAISVKFGLHRYIAVPAIAELSILIIFTGLIGRFISII